MGDPRKLRKKYSGPRHPWQRQRLESEKEYVREFGLRNKQELWKMSSTLSKYASQAKALTPKLQSNKSAQAEKEMKQLIEKVSSLGLLSLRANMADVLTLSVRDVLERRLQTVVYKKGLARSVNQARQFITHGHVMVDNKMITSPSYLVKVSEEGLISFAENSKLSDETHPERSTVVKEVEEKVEPAPKKESAPKKEKSEGDKPKEKKADKEPSKKEVSNK